MSEYFRWTHPVARISHKCSICYRAIQPGEKYDRCDALGIEGAASWKECQHCIALTRLYDIEGGDGERPGPDDVGQWEPNTVTELRHRTYWSKSWTRKDGTLYPIPEAIN